MRLRIPLFTLIRIRIHIKEIPVCDQWPPRFHFEPPRLYCERTWPSLSSFWLSLYSLQLLNFDFDADIDPDPNPALTLIRIRIQLCKIMRNRIRNPARHFFKKGNTKMTVFLFGVLLSLFSLVVSLYAIYDVRTPTRVCLKVHKIEIFLASILKFVLFLY
jgi:hypothetical protein